MSEKVINKISVANPTGLGLFGLAMVTFVAASQKLGITKINQQIKEYFTSLN